MQVLTRGVVWCTEMIVQALCLGFLILFISHTDAPIKLSDIVLITIGTLVYFTLFGYSITTAIARFLWHGTSVWSYPVLAAILFLAHFQLLNFTVQGAMDARGRWLFRFGGAGIAFATTLLGTLYLRILNSSRSDGVTAGASADA